MLTAIFDDFARISGLALNLRKTVLIPLWLQDLAEVYASVIRTSPSWGSMQVRLHGTYLGIVIGPHSPHKSWGKAMLKFDARVADWAQRGLGLYLSVVA